MQVFLAFVFIVVFGLIGFSYYTQSGVVLNEAIPKVTETPASEKTEAPKEEVKPETAPVSEEKKTETAPAQTTPADPSSQPLMDMDQLKKTLPDEPTTEEALGPNTTQEINGMVKKAEESSMTPEEKREMETKLTEMMKPISNPAEEPPKETATVPEPQRKGSFTEIDVIHKGSGEAFVYNKTAEGPLLRLQNFSVTRGPDLYVYLSKNADIKEASQLGEYASLGVLKSSKGNQNYKLPENHQDYKSVVIWCQAFGVLFSSATLNP